MTFSATTTYGTQTTDGPYTVITCLRSDTLVCEGSIEAEILLVGGGGGGGNTYGGGGGAGDLLDETDVTLTGSMLIVIGDGGAGGITDNGGDGETSSFAGFDAIGGGGGGGRLDDVYETFAGNDGASGGGGTYSMAGGSATGVEGNDGGDGFNLGSPLADYTGGGGGGAGTPGVDGTEYVQGNGGDGVLNPLTGVGYLCGGGGAGGNANSSGGSGEDSDIPGTGGSGVGGGGGSSDNTAGYPGAPNTGSGGGGGYGNVPQNTGSPGGSGLLIIRYLTPPIEGAANQESSFTLGLEATVVVLAVVNLMGSFSMTATPTVIIPDIGTASVATITDSALTVAEVTDF